MKTKTFTSSSLRNIFQILIQDDGKLPAEIPAVIEQNIARIKELLPNAKHHLLCGDEIRVFIKDKFDAGVLTAYDTLRPYPYKADLARLSYLYELGGLYRDLCIYVESLPNLKPAHRIAIFQDNYSELPWGVKNGLIISAPQRPEFKLAIDLIVKNVTDRFYGSNSLEPTGPNCLGSAFALIADTKRYWVGDFARLRSTEGKISYAYFAPFGDCIARRTKEEAGDLKSIGLMQTNNYRKMYSIERVYGEMEAVEIPEEWPVLARRFPHGGLPDCRFR